MPPVEFVMINNYLIDVSVKEDHSFTADVTDYPVESGGSLSDNIRPKPITVTIEGIVSNSPLGEITTSRRTFAGPLATGQASTAEAYALLLAVWNGREPVTIRTSLGTFERMALTSLSIPKSKESGDALHFTAAFQQITLVTNAEYRVATRTSIPNGGKKRDRGSQASDTRALKFIIWRKGRPPGSYYIYDTQVVWFQSQSTGPGRQDSMDYYHPDGDGGFAGSVLTSPEHAAFEKDMARDLSDAADAKRAAGGDAVLSKLTYLQQKGYVKTPPSTSTLSRKPSANLSDRSRVQLKDGSGLDPLKKAFSGPNGSTGF